MKTRLRLDAAARYAAASLALLAIMAWQCAEARAQWTTGTNISNTNSGNVGVGTSAPGAKLDVGAGAAARGSNTDLLVGAGGNLPQIEFYGPTRSTAIQYDESAGGLLFWTNAPAWTQTLFLGNSGWVGVGTSAPADQLHVKNSGGVGFARVTGAGGGVMNFEDSSAGADQKLYQWRSEGGLFRLALSNDASTALVRQNILVANSSGSVGVGTASPASVLHVLTVGATKPQFLLQNATATTQIETSLSGATAQWNYGMDQADGGKFKFSTDGGGDLGAGVKLTLDAAGNLTSAGAITGATVNATYQDVAEWVPSTQKLSAGTVVVLDTTQANHVLASTREYDTKVAGVISDNPGVILGQGGADKVKVATTGRVKVMVDATRAPISVGDLLVTSDVEGVAMKSIPVDLGGTQIHRPGTIIGKALEPLASGAGEILVLLSLQ